MRITDMKPPPLRTWPWRGALAAVFVVLFLIEMLVLAVMWEPAP